MTYKDDLLSNYDYKIPEKLIAQKPVENRQDSRLFVVNRGKQKFYHGKFSDIIEYFIAGDCLIINTTKIVPSKLLGRKRSKGKVEVLFLDSCQKNEDYKVLLKPFIS
jgi:S-adenosylmethionine:tRNA ribosyltransferase-isomerase